MKWFKHLTASRSDPDIGEAIDAFGFKGYYLFFRTLEIMADEFNPENPGKNTFNFSWFLDQFSRRIDKKTLCIFFEFTEKKGRIFATIEGKQIHLNCPKLKGLCDEYTAKMTAKLSGQTPDTESGLNPEHRIRSKNKKKDLKEKKEETPPQNQQIKFNPKDGNFENITKDHIADWKERFKGISIDLEIEKMKNWLIDNPHRRKKIYEYDFFIRFITSWLKRAMDDEIAKRKKSKAETQHHIGSQQPRNHYKELNEGQRRRVKNEYEKFIEKLMEEKGWKSRDEIDYFQAPTLQEFSKNWRKQNRREGVK